MRRRHERLLGGDAVADGLRLDRVPTREQATGASGGAPERLVLPDAWEEKDYERFVDEVRRLVDTQQADKRDVRSRAQVTLSTALVLSGAVVAGGSTHKDSPGLLIAHIVAFILVGIAGLASAGVMTARSDVGAANLHNLAASQSSDLAKDNATEYAAIAYVGSATVAVLVTVLRSCVLFLLLGFLIFAGLYVLAA